MTVFAKSPAYGLEVSVSKLQTVLESALTWLGTNNIYGIIFKNADKDNIIPEAWVGDGAQGKEYIPVFNNDKSTSQIGFLPLDRNVLAKTSTVQIICTIDLIKAYGANIRDNERAYLELQNAIEQKSIVLEDSFKQGIEDVFSGFRTDNIKYLDMQPFDCFSFEVEISYPNNPPCQ
jgi:hypothetical protein